MFTIIFNVYVCFFISALFSKQHFVDFIAKTKSLYCISQSFMVKLCVLCMCAARCVCVCVWRQNGEKIATRADDNSLVYFKCINSFSSCALGVVSPLPTTCSRFDGKTGITKKKLCFTFFLAVETEKKNHLHVGLITSLFAYFMICHCDFT